MPSGVDTGLGWQGEDEIADWGRKCRSAAFCVRLALCAAGSMFWYERGEMKAQPVWPNAYENYVAACSRMRTEMDRTLYKREVYHRMEMGRAVVFDLKVTNTHSPITRSSY